MKAYPWCRGTVVRWVFFKEAVPLEDSLRPTIAEALRAYIALNNEGKGGLSKIF